MPTNRIRRLTALGSAAVALALCVAQPALADDRPAAEILADLAGTQMPQFDRARADAEGAEYVAAFRAQSEEAGRARAVLIGELHQAHPGHEQLDELLPERWQLLLSGGELDVAAAETERVASDSQGDLAVDALYFHAMTTVYKTQAEDSSAVLAAAAKFRQAAPADQRNAELLGYATYGDADDATLLTIYKDIQANFPDAREARSAASKIFQLERVGKPFELSFQDAITGETVDMSQLRGKVVVIDFWATWCGPCIAELPHMKELYATYKDKGVEFVGISLDAPRNESDPSKDGLKKLRDFVADRELPWPQYYQGNGWESEFSTGWKVRSIPTIFLVDQQGRLVTPNARGKLDTLIPETLGIEKAG
ncbi:MAG: TlpA disulfide reductase family protein [Planctomycetota bacterium]